LLLEKARLYSLSRSLPSSPTTSRRPTAFLPRVRALSFSSFRNDNNNNANKKGKETGARYCTQIHPQFSCEEGIEEKKKEAQITGFIRITTRELK
jgi:hypothetical protein